MGYQSSSSTHVRESIRPDKDLFLLAGSKSVRDSGHVARVGEKRMLVGTPERKGPLRRTRCRWVETIKMDIREIGWDGMDWIDLAQDRDQWRALVNTVMNLRVP
jgi:hypothetical protein